MKDKSSDKKLVQARLPFKTLSPHSTGVDKSSNAKKRKLSNAIEDGEQVIKKVFVKDSIANNDVIEVTDDENSINNVVPNFNPVVRILDNVDKLVEENKKGAENVSADKEKVDSDSNNDSVICMNEDNDDSESKDESDSSQKLDNSLVVTEDDDNNSKQNEETNITPSRKFSAKQVCLLIAIYFHFA